MTTDLAKQRPSAEAKPLTLRDPELLKCPYQAYEYLREHAPVYFDSQSGLWVISRYEDARLLLADRTALNSEHATEKLRGAADPARASRIAKLFEEKGWPRERPVGNYEGEEYRERRELFESFLRAGKVRDYEPLVRDIACSLAQKLALKTEADLVSEYSEQISLRVICGLLGASDDTLPIVKESMEAMVANLGHIGSEEEEVQGALKEIAAQHHFKRLIDAKRAQPDDTLLSGFINAKLKSGTPMTDPQILMHVMLDLFMAGAETSARAITSGVYMLCQDPALQERLRSDLDGHLRTFAEEVLRLEGPASGIFRVALRDIELHGETIPKGAVVTIRLAAANRDGRHFACPADVDLERDNAATHLSFGSGPHSCVGAPLARRELYWGFKALLETLQDIRLAPNSNPEFLPNMLFRGLPELRITFARRN
jgi:cytochrome P450